MYRSLTEYALNIHYKCFNDTFILVDLNTISMLGKLHFFQDLFVEIYDRLIRTI